jgi:hypothetical protein
VEDNKDLPTVTTITSILSLFYWYFSFEKVHISIFRSVLLDPEKSEQAMGISEHQGWPGGPNNEPYIDWMAAGS